MKFTMTAVQWVHPESLDELRRHLADGVRLHGGGTGLMRNRPASGTLADLSNLHLDSCETNPDGYRFGGTASIARVAATVAREEPHHIAATALSRMAAPALRNRITIGGSVALFPPWSSVVGPLLASNARVTLVGASESTVGLADYLARRELRAGTAVVAVELERQGGVLGSWYGHARTRFNYPLFGVVVLGRADAGLVRDLRIVLTGIVGRYARLSALEARLDGTPPREVSPAELGVSIPDRQGESGAYLTHRAAVAVTRGLEAVAAGGAS